MLKLGLSLIGVLVLLWVLIRLYRKFKAVKLGLSPRKNLMDKLVREFKLQLEMAVGEEYEAHPHVRLADLLVVETAKGKKALDIRSRIEMTSTDLVLTEKATGNIACVLILIHQEKLGSRQKFIREICQQGKLPFQIFDVNNAYSEKQIRQEITMLLEPTIRLEDSPAHEIKIYLDPEQRRPQESDTDPEQSVSAETRVQSESNQAKKTQQAVENISQSTESPSEQDKTTYASEKQPNKKYPTQSDYSLSEQRPKRTGREAAKPLHNKQDNEPEFDLSVD